MELQDCDHNSQISTYIRVRDIKSNGSGKRAYRLIVETNNSELTKLIIWEQSPAVNLEWESGQWYRVQDVLVKQWENTIELNATDKTTAEPIDTPDNPSQNRYDTSDGSTTKSIDRCGFSWQSDNDDHPDVEPRGNCCYRPTWSNFDRCIWHAETDLEKPPDELEKQRQTSELRITNGQPRELLHGAYLKDADLTDMVFTRADLSGANLESANFTGAYLQGANFSQADLSHANFQDCTLSWADFSDAELEHTDLSGTSLVGVDFTNAKLNGAKFTEATVRKADFTNTEPEELNRSEINIDEVSGLDSDSKQANSPSLLHVGPSHYSSSNITRWRRQEFHSVLNDAAEIAFENNADAIILTGQLFATRSPTEKAISKLKDLLHRIRDNGVHFLHAGSERDYDMDLVDELLEEGLLTRLGDSPVVVGNTAIYGIPPVEVDNPQTALKNIKEPPSDTEYNILCAPATVEPPAQKGQLSLDTIIQQTPISLSSILAGHRDIDSPQTAQVESRPPVYLIGPTEFMLRKYALDSPPVYPCKVALYRPEEHYEYYEVNNRPVEIYIVECTTRTTLSDLQAEVEPEKKNILISLRGKSTRGSISKESVERWLDSHTNVYKLWDDRGCSKEPAEPPQDSSISVKTVTKSQSGESERSKQHETDIQQSATDTANLLSALSDKVETNRISELYESFRSLYTALELLMGSSATQINPDAMTSIPVQYKTVIEAIFWNDEYLPDQLEGLGTQQNERVSSSMSDYREAHGNGDWVTDYQEIEVQSLSETIQSILELYNLVEDAAVFVRPVSPGVGIPVPEFPETESEFSRALYLLSQFKSRPSLSLDSDPVFQFPVEAVYRQVCDEENVEKVNTSGKFLDRNMDLEESKNRTKVLRENSIGYLNIDNDIDLQQLATKLEGNLDATHNQIQDDLTELIEYGSDIENVVVTVNTMYGSQDTSQTLWDIVGIGLKRGHLLYHAGFTTPEDVADASVDEISVRGISKRAALCIQETARNACGQSPAMAEELANRLGVTRQEVASHYERLAGRLVIPQEARKTLEQVLVDPPAYSVYTLDELNLSETHFLFENGFESISEIATASISELEETEYLSRVRAKNIREIARDECAPDSGNQRPKQGTDSVGPSTSGQDANEKDSTDGSDDDCPGNYSSNTYLHRTPDGHSKSTEVETKFPQLMVKQDQWLIWKENDGRKIPRAPWQTGENLQYVDATDPENWISFGHAKEWIENIPQTCELAFALTPSDPIVFIDLDDVIENDCIADTAHSLVASADSYTAKSTSGEGLHIFIEDELPPEIKSITGDLGGNESGSIEVYDRNRFVAMTGAHLTDTPDKILPANEFIESLRSEYAQVSSQTPDSAMAEPKLSRKEVQNTNVTSDVENIFAAIEHTRPSDIRMRSKQTNKRGDGTYSYDPSWVNSESGTRLGVLDDIWIYRDGMIALDALQVVALEEGIISDEHKYPEGTEFWKAVEKLRDRGAAIPRYQPDTSPIDTSAAEPETQNSTESEVAQIINHGNPVRPHLDDHYKNYQEKLAIRLAPIIVENVEELNLPVSAAYRAAEVYEKAQAAGIVFGQAHECSLGVGLRIAAIETGKPRPLENIGQVLNEDPESIRQKFQKTMTQTDLSEELDSSDLIIKPEEYSSYTARKLGVKSEKELCEKVRKRLDECNYNTEANPVAVVASAFYAVMKQSDQYRTKQEEIATQTGFSKVTIRNHYRTFLE